MKVKAGDIVTFRGCVWSAGWEFDAPLVIYEPVKRFSDDGSISPLSVLAAVENICIDLACDGEVRDGWSPGDLKEFSWRGWKPAGFKHRKSACHAEITVKFHDDDDGLAFEVIAAAHVDKKTGRLTPFLDGVPVTVVEKGN